MASKYVDTTSIVQVLGCIYNDPRILDAQDVYNISENDFPEEFHRILMGTFLKLHEDGVDHFTLETINDYLENHPKAHAVFEVNRGNEY